MIEQRILLKKFLSFLLTETKVNTYRELAIYCENELGGIYYL